MGTARQHVLHCCLCHPQALCPQAGGIIAHILCFLTLFVKVMDSEAGMHRSSWKQAACGCCLHSESQGDPAVSFSFNALQLLS